jgi:methionyl-tRNA formyltransferase
MNDLKVVFMGNGSFAVPSLRLLHESGISLKGVVTNPPKRIGRGKSLKLTAVGQEATNLGLNVLPTEELKSSLEFLFFCFLLWSCSIHYLQG